MESQDSPKNIILLRINGKYICFSLFVSCVQWLYDTNDQLKHMHCLVGPKWCYWSLKCVFFFSSFFNGQKKSLKVCHSKQQHTWLKRKKRINKWKLVRSSNTWSEDRGFHLQPYISRVPVRMRWRKNCLSNQSRW